MRNNQHAVHNLNKVEPLHSPSQRQLPFGSNSRPGPEESSCTSPVVTNSGFKRSKAASMAGRHPEELSSEDDVQQNDDLAIEEEVEYLLAKQFKSVKTSERLGFPVYSADKKLLGFYQEFGNFVPIPTDFGPTEKLKAPPAAVHAKQGRSIAKLLDHALVYEWSQGLLYTDESGRNYHDKNKTGTK